jgi:hypothetical protein
MIFQKNRCRHDWNEAMTTINSYNSTLPDMAKRSGATFVAPPAMTRPSTIDRLIG